MLLCVLCRTVVLLQLFVNTYGCNQLFSTALADSLLLLIFPLLFPLLCSSYPLFDISLPQVCRGPRITVVPPPRPR